MVHRATYKHFKSCQNLTITLGNLCVIVGPNGSGKTSILEGIQAPPRALHLTAENNAYFGARLKSWRSRGTANNLSINLGFDEGSIEFNARESENSNISDGRYHIDQIGWTFSLSYMGNQDDQPKAFDGLSAEMKDRIRNSLSAELLEFRVDELARPSSPQTEVPRIGVDGSGLGSYLAHLKLSDEERFNAVSQALHRIVPNVREIKFDLQPLSSGDSFGYHMLFDTNNAKAIPAEQMSEGTLLVLGLLAIINSVERPRTLLLDDIDRALHPRAQENLIAEIRRLQVLQSDVQIIATSHSPYLLDYLEPDEVRITNINDDGTVSCGKLTEHPEFERWKDQMSPGEFWSMVGEDWVGKNSQQPAG